MAIDSPIAWTTVENAIYSWFYLSTSIPTVWAEQDSPKLAYPFATLKITSRSIKTDGQDEQRWTYDPLQPIGQEVGIEVCGQRELVVSTQIHALAQQAPGDFMSRAQIALGLPSYLAALDAAGLAVVGEGPVQTVSAKLDDTWITRAMMDVRFRLAASVVERTGYIAEVVFEPSFNGDLT